MRFCHFQLLVLFACVILSSGWEYEIQRIEDGSGEDPFWDISNLKVVRIKKGVYGLDGDAVLKTDFDDNYTFEIKALYSPTGSSHFQRTPLRIPPNTFCGFLNTNYKQFFMENLSKVSNFPVIGDEYYCPLPAQTYNFDHYEFDKNTLPEMKNGYYQLLLLFNSTTDDRRAQWKIFVKVTDM